MLGLIALLQVAKNYFNEWYKNIDKDKYYLVLTNDIDSYLSCCYLSKKFGVQIGAFYDFGAMYHNTDITKGKEPIFVDCDVVKGKCFGNHVTAIKNAESINLNCNITTSNYNRKFAGSTLFTLFSLYDEPLERFTDEQLFLLLGVDVWFKQYYKYPEQWEYWSKIMEYEKLSDILKDKTIEDCYSTLLYYKLNSTIEINEQMQLVFPLEYKTIVNDFGLYIPELSLCVTRKVIDYKKWSGYAKAMLDKNIDVFSNAMIYKDKVAYSYMN